MRDRALFAVLLAVVAGILAVTSVAAVTTPAATTRYATYITASTARLNAVVDDDGGEPCDVQFQYYYDDGDWTDNETGWLSGYVTGDLPYADIDSLTANTLYYFRVEIRNSSGGAIDGDSVSFNAYNAPTMPSTWFQTPDYTRFHNFPTYGLFNYLADLMSMPRGTFWLLATLFICIALGVLTLIIGKRLVPAVIVLAVMMALSSLVRLLPMYFVLFSVIFTLGVIKMGHPREE